MGFFVERKGYTRLATAGYDLVADLLANGFTKKYPIQAVTKPADGTFTAYTVILEPSATVNSLQASQYAIRIEFSADDTFKLDITTPTLLNYTDGTIQYLDLDEQKESAFWTRSRTANYLAWPMSYTLSITDRGVAFCIWENDQDKAGNMYAWFAVQRPVDKSSGTKLDDSATSHCPVFAIIKTQSNANIEYFTVCETDIMRPTKRVSAVEHTEDSYRVINSAKQVMITEDGKYVIDFPCRFNTPRYSYTQEFDMIGITSADVVSQGSDIATTVYGEATARTYYALLANGANNTGARLLMLKAGGGI